MRLDVYAPIKAVPDPKSRSGLVMKFTSGHLGKTPEDYDLYLVNGTVYVCRDGHVGVYFEHGACYVSGDEGEKLSKDLAKKWPRPKPADASPSSHS